MALIPGYILYEIIYDGAKTLVYRGRREEDSLRVVIKVFKAEFPTFKETTRLKQEYQLLSNLNIPGIIKPYGLVAYENKLALILEDIGGVSLKEFMEEQQRSLSDILAIAIQVATTLGELHEQNIIHQDIKPKNIIINPQTGDVKITDFGIASRLSELNPILSYDNAIQGTLAYISPEQSGRMNRGIDYRTDFYSLGVTLYQLLSGELPFQTSDSLELIHCHIAKSPTPLHDVNSQIPKILSDIVLKLLAKNAEDRYQSAYGLKFDLEQCLQSLQTTGDILPFPLGQQDRGGKLLIPQKLYGREAEVNDLLQSFQRVSRGASEILLVTGYSGIGKSCLVQEVHKPILQQRGYFFAGKFDQFKRDIPYGSLIQAFQDLIKQLLTESAEKLQVWKEKILTNLGDNGQVIIDVIPEVELVIGEQPKVAQLSASESQNRFHRVFQEFIRVFTQKEHPLVLFLDDLQWADSPSLKLIQTLISDRDRQYLLLIGAYRDNEVTSLHPLTQTLEQIRSCGIAIKNIFLSPLKLVDVQQLIADTLKMGDSSNILAETLFEQTHGNPFFLTQLLKTLSQERLLKFDANNCCWTWDLEEIRALGVTDNVVDLMLHKINKLPQVTQNILKLAACIGNRFDLSTLSIISEKSTIKIATDLWPALSSGLVIPLSNAYKIPLVVGEETAAALNFDNLVNYKFLHDRVQQAAYSLISEYEQKATHLKIGQLLLKNWSPGLQLDNIFELVNHLNYGRKLIPDRTTKYQLASLNLIAGKKAISSVAYEPALSYLRIALKLLSQGKDSWKRQYHLTLEVYLAIVEAEYLNANFLQAEFFSNIALEQAKTILDRVEIFQKKIQLYCAQNKMLSALDTGRQVLQLLKVPLLNYDRDRSEVFELPQLSDLENLQIMTDPNKLAAMKIMMNIASPAYIAEPKTYIQIISTLVNLSIKHGYSALSAFAFAQYGTILCGAMGNFDAGYLSCELALKLLDIFKASSLKTRVYVAFYGFVKIWKEHLRSTLTPTIEAIQSGLEVGNIEFAGYNASRYCDHLFFLGEPLEVAREQLAQYLELMLKYKQEFNINYINVWYQAVDKLQTEAPYQKDWVRESFDDAVKLPLLFSTNNQISIFCVYLAKAILAYLFQDEDYAIENAAIASNYLPAVMGSINVAEHNFYFSLALLANYPNKCSSSKEDYLRQVQQNQITMQHWALNAEENFQHKYDLVEAEKARVLGQPLQAMEYYDLAINGAKQQGYTQEIAIASELAARFYFSLKRYKIAESYIVDAYYGYASWGARAKVKDLEVRYPQLIAKNSYHSATLSTTIAKSLTSTSSSSTSLLDLETVIKASQAIAGEIFLEQLLNKLIKIVLENAGAERGILLSEKDGDWVIVTASNSENFTSNPEGSQYPMSVINYVKRTLDNVVLGDARTDAVYHADPYIVASQPKSILCTPIFYQGQLRNILYLENNLTTNAFTPSRIKILRILSAQIAISLENAQLYHNLSVANVQLEDYSRTLELKVADRTQQLERVNQDLSDFAHVVSHDLKAPLRSIKMLVEWFVADYTDILDESGQEQLNLMVEQVQKALSLIQGILHYSRMGLCFVENQPVNISELVDEVINVLSPPSNINIIIESELPTVVGDAIRIRQVFQNLLSNAIKYIDKPQGCIKIACSADANQWQFSIADNGCGIEEKHFDRIFQLFQTLKPKEKSDSSGVGLSIVRKIVELYNGMVWVESQVGEGSTFFFTLPRSGG